MKNLKKTSIQLLKDLVSTQSFSKSEDNAAIIIRKFLQQNHIGFISEKNNTWAKNKLFSENKPTLLLNSHIDTVKPANNWLTNPFAPIEENGKIIGLGSNDAGASLVALMATFIHFYEQDLPFNIIIAATAEEEISGKNGIALIKDQLNADFAIVGEPTTMKMATAERGLMVLDCEVLGEAGHAARNEGINALYLALEDINWIKNHQFEKISPELGPIKMTVTIINAGQQHNVVPDKCNYTVDLRTTAAYNYEELLEIIDVNTHALIQPRSTRLKPSAINPDHPLVKAASNIDIPTFGSSTLSDQALMDIPSVKMGPGKSERSHTAGEFIFIHEIEEGIDTYIQLINQLKEEF